MDEMVPTGEDFRAAADVADASMGRAVVWLTLANAAVWQGMAASMVHERGFDLMSVLFVVVAALFLFQAGASWALRLRRSPHAKWLYRNLAWQAGTAHAHALAKAVHDRAEATKQPS